MRPFPVVPSNASVVFLPRCLLPISSSLQDSPKDPVISSNVEAKFAEDQQGGLSGIIVTTKMEW
ncbi:MAG: hypothetical protein KF848_09220 [Nitrospira sp.]|nr:hypothetical protein [Nitrospira sp.]